MEMLRKILTPGVQDRGDPDRATEVSRVSTEREQGVGGGAEEQRVNDARIALCERVQIVRQGEDDVEVRNGQQVGAPRREPSRGGKHLTLRTMPIATGVVGDPHGAAVITRLLMAAEGGRAAGLDRVERPVLDGGEAMRTAIRVAVGAHDVRELQSRTDGRDRRASRHGAHGLSLRGPGKTLEQIEW
jgi:hypothetical protein